MSRALSRCLGFLASLLLCVIVGWGLWTYALRPALLDVVTATPLPSSTPPVIAERDVAGATAQARRFLTGWATGRYAAMYHTLSAPARRAVSQAAFVARYERIAAAATVTAVHPLLTRVEMHPGTATATYTVVLSTAAVGAVTYTGQMALRRVGGRWGIDWTPNLIVPGLVAHGARYLVHLYPALARRGSIVDRLGRPLATNEAVLPIGVVPKYIADERSLVAFLAGWLQRDPAAIRAAIHPVWARAHPDDLVPIAQVTPAQWHAVPAQVRDQQQHNGLCLVCFGQDQGTVRRVYPAGTLAAPLLGYVSASDGRGAAGLEAWADGYVRGHDGGTLALTDSPAYRTIVSVIKHRPAQDGATVHLTLDRIVQQAAETALAGKVGAIVALRPSDSAILALASTPGYNPNRFVRGLSPAAYRALVGDPHAPLLDRAVTGQYPPGAIFTLVTMGAALAHGYRTTGTSTPCPGLRTGRGPAVPPHKRLPRGDGDLSLHEALVQSCDTVFSQVGLDLNRRDRAFLPRYVRSFGFGGPTGIIGLREGTGAIPDPRRQGWTPAQAADLAIGQGGVTVTPLQVAQLLGALGNGGVMYRPYLVSSITGPHATPLRTYAPVVARVLPLSVTQRREVLAAMRGVTTEPTGTARAAFAGFGWPVAGKTGTAAMARDQAPHAWFVALAPAARPRIALVVFVAHGGDGAQVAAPLARQVLQTFFTQDRDLASPSQGYSPREWWGFRSDRKVEVFETALTGG